MRKVLFVIVAGVLSLWLGGCGNEPSEEEVTSTPAVTEETPAPDAGEEAETVEGQAETETPEEAKEGETPFEEPLVSEQPDTASEAGLIQSTKAEERLLQLQGGRRNGGNAVATAPATAPNASIEDPFAPLPPAIASRPVNEEEAIETLALESKQVPDLPALPVTTQPPQWRNPIAVAVAPGAAPGGGRAAAPGAAPGGGRTAAPGGGRAAAPGATPGGRQTAAPGAAPAGRQTAPQAPPIPDLTVAGVPDLPALPITETPPPWIDPNAPPPAAPAAPPPPPPTDLARGIEVTGVVKTDTDTKVIVKAPNEPTSRYVSVGQRIANGQVLVKRVKFSPDSDPIVIFEQNGVEIARMVGETSQPPGESANMIVMPPSSDRLRSSS
jgi:hypothetical protein